MNEQSTKLLEQLAYKLGTTTEYLWGVLIKQAPIAATTQLCQTIGVIIFGFILWKIHKYLLKENDKGYSRYSTYEEGAAIPMVIGLIIFMFCIIACFICFSDVINGYFNPEYWALDSILNKCK